MSKKIKWKILSYKYYQFPDTTRELIIKINDIYYYQGRAYRSHKLEKIIKYNKPSTIFVPYIYLLCGKEFEKNNESESDYMLSDQQQKIVIEKDDIIFWDYAK